MAGCLITAPASGSGKTMVVCGLLRLFQRRGKRPWAFKCGPDYIDGLFHQQVLQAEGGNLDGFFETPEHMRGKYRRAAREQLVIVEGAMGYFDGLGGIESRASAWETAEWLGLPSILVVDGRGASGSLAALVHGFLSYRAEKGGTNRIAAVILNRMSPMLYPRIKELLERETGVAVAGFVPPLDFWKVESRHLGLVLPGELPGLREQVERLADCMEQTIDWRLLLRLAERAACPEDTERREADALSPRPGLPFRLGIARDEAFCFYYRDNLELLEELGAELVEFSPLRDQRLPERLAGLLLGGGYPENHGAALSANQELRREISQAARGGMPVLAECGGYLYLLEELEGADGDVYPMAGVLKGRGVRRGRTGRFGYLTLRPEEDTLCLKRGEEIRGHEFHYWDSTGYEDPCRMTACKPVGMRSWPCMRTSGRVTAGFPHLYYPSCPAFARRFADACRDYAEEGRKAAEDREETGK